MFGEHALEIGAVSADVVETFVENASSPVACLNRLGAPDMVDLGIARVEPVHEAGIAVDFQEREELVSEFSLKSRLPSVIIPLASVARATAAVKAAKRWNCVSVRPWVTRGTPWHPRQGEGRPEIPCSRFLRENALLSEFQV
jgi:hypothetical protein